MSFITSSRRIVDCPPHAATVLGCGGYAWCLFQVFGETLCAVDCTLASLQQVVDHWPVANCFPRHRAGCATFFGRQMAVQHQVPAWPSTALPSLRQGFVSLLLASLQWLYMAMSECYWGTTSKVAGGHESPPKPIARGVLLPGCSGKSDHCWRESPPPEFIKPSCPVPFFPLFWEGFLFEVNQPKKDANYFFPHGNPLGI